MKNLLNRLPQWFVKAAQVVWETLRDTWKLISRAQLLTVAASLAYTTILSVIPLIAVSFAVFQAFGGLEKLQSTIEPFILSNLAEGASDEVIQRIHGMIRNVHGGALGAGGLIGLLFTSIAMLFSIEKSINSVWGTPIRRSMFQRLTAYWFFITLGPIALAVALGFASSTAGSPWLAVFPSGSGFFVLTAFLFTLIYKYVPNCYVHWPLAGVAGVFTATLWNLGRIGYAIYTKRAVSYNQIYGSLAAIPLLLFWIFIAWMIVLVGAALAAVLQKRLEEKHFIEDEKG